MDQLTKFPSVFTAGDYFNLLLSLSDYPAPTWNGSFVLINSTNKIQIDSADDGADLLFQVADTSGWAAGDYAWQFQVTDGTNRHTIDSGHITIKPDFSAAAAYDSRSFHAKMVELLEADCLIKETDGVTSYAVFGRSVQYSSHEERLRALRYHRRMLAKEKARAAGKTGFGLIKTRFN